LAAPKPICVRPLLLVRLGQKPDVEVRCLATVVNVHTRLSDLGQTTHLSSSAQILERFPADEAILHQSCESMQPVPNIDAARGLDRAIGCAEWKRTLVPPLVKQLEQPAADDRIFHAVHYASPS